MSACMLQTSNYISSFRVLPSKWDINYYVNKISGNPMFSQIVLNNYNANFQNYQNQGQSTEGKENKEEDRNDDKK